MNKIQLIHNKLHKEFGPQGWWPLINPKTLVVEHKGRIPKTDNERFQVICGCILTQNTNWYPNVVRALQQLYIGRVLTKEELEWIKQAEIKSGEAPEIKLKNKQSEASKKAEIIPSDIPENSKKQTKADILTQNTNWHPNVEKALYNLNKKNLIDLKKIKKIPHSELAELIRPSGYYNQKAERIKIIANFFDENIDFFIKDDDISKLRTKLLDIKGIGPETADSILLYAFNKPVFVIDAYTKRMMAGFGFEFEDYDELQKIFMKSLEKDSDLFKEYHALIVELGKNCCKNKKPLCVECALNNMCKKPFRP